MYIYFLIFIVSIFLTNISIPFVKKKAEYFNIFDKPELRKQHKSAMVRLGGISIFFSFLITLFIYDIFSQDLFIRNNFGIIFLITCFFITGLIDDIFKTKPWPRLMVEVFLASIAWINNLGFYAIDFSIFSLYEYSFTLPTILSYTISVFWIVGITNAINWMDGLDGLASGIVFIYAIGIGLISYLFGNFNELIFLSAICGVCLGFLKSNFYPSKILMGDGGSYLLGFCISIFSISGSTRALTNNSNLISTSIFIPFILLFIPMMDMVYVIFKRLATNKSPFYPDRNHLHHRILDIGFSQRNAVLTIYLLGLINVVITILYKLST